MGATFSKLETERTTWLEHIILYDESVRQCCLPLIDAYFPLGSKINLASKDRTVAGLKYQHWFLTNSEGNKFLEFGMGDDIYTARVSINVSARSDYVVVSAVTVTDELHQRISHVVGMYNYSLCLRNCEHVANYVAKDRWISSQMNDGGQLMDYFKDLIVGENLKKVNAFPSNIRPHIFTPGVARVPLYSIIPAQYLATEFSYFLDHNENTYNILVVGPTGAGKSHLINLFFNQRICDSKPGHESVTKEVCFVRGTGNIMDFKTGHYVRKKIVVADTVGLCDTEWNDEQIFRLIKGRVSSNFKFIDAVFMVFKADRLLKEHISSMKKIMEWLQYSKGTNCMKFMFVATHAEHLSVKDITCMKADATRMLGLKDTTIYWTSEQYQCHFDSLVYTGFPPEDTLNDLGKARIQNSWRQLQWLLGLHPGDQLQAIKETGGRFHQVRLAVGKVKSSCIIL